MAGCHEGSFGLFSNSGNYQEPFFTEIFFLFSIATQGHYQYETQIIFELQIKAVWSATEKVSSSQLFMLFWKNNLNGLYFLKK